jgi:hypothetical protein
MSEGRKESFGFGNIYTTRQMKQWLEFFLRRRKWSDQTLYQDNENLSYDYLLPHFDPVSSPVELSRKRHMIREEFISQISIANVFIFTCGLTELWSTRLGEVLTICPGTVFGEYDPKAHYFQNLDFGDILEDLSKIEEYISEFNPNIKFIYTISPVPLTATAEDEHVLVATCFSKSKLRAAVGEHVRKSKDSKYFPAYELITHSNVGDWRFESNLRSVSTNGVEYVMRHGFKEEMKNARLINKQDDYSNSIDIHCEEEKLETANRLKLKFNDDQQFF